MLHDAVESRDLKGVKELLKQPGVKVNSVSLCNKFTPLTSALIKGYDDIADALLNDSRINVNKEDDYGNLPFGLAAMKEKTKILQKIAEKSAENINSSDLGSSSPIHWAISAHKVDMLEYLLSKGVDANRLDGENCTPFFRAIHLGYIDMATMLLTYPSISPNKVSN